MSPFKKAYNYLKQYIASEKRGLILAAVSALVIVLAFTVYLKKVGVPMTSARNEYNSAVQMYNAHNYIKAKQLLEQSLHDWQTPEAQQLLEQITQQDPGL
jgi:predicted negative regulator of RcsB-dependent stress response